MLTRRFTIIQPRRRVKDAATAPLEGGKDTVVRTEPPLHGFLLFKIEDDPKGKKKLGNRKHVEDDESEDDSSKPESEGGSESEPNSEKTISQDENLGKRQRRTRIPLQPPQNEESELNADAAIDVDPAPAAVDPPHQHAAAENHEDVPVNPQECGKEVVEATTAEEELIRIDLSKSNTNLVMETQVEKGVIDQQDLGRQELTLKDWSSKSDPKDDIPTDKEV
ncbi:hypothetical protein PIB30_006835 [Stylosanthes scabra]|uniref:Uncharacterized protein n=1 Tax=Stylosanthes scabra TaxID=79078 RepID=A0ABU6V465_9FABA|nr:hypothetical protein [Stylosanthes scabra]